ncbi:MAG TPA: glutamate--tRNA ligase [Candidatus Paceibacterota bacterium]|nr:glutamate--tRNA ligase [Candidatus Paceibacterota bacterium]
MTKNSKIRVRFAPSPTGLFHVGSARTTLFNYLFAKHNKGDFILRIEDTDKQRSKKEFEKDILEGIKWLGLKWDELYYQSKRTKIYEKYLKELLDSGKAYKKEIIWFRNPNKKVVFNDIIRGNVEVDSSVLGDFSIAKDLKTPLYNFAAVIDDFEMKISHVIRGEDHITNTSKQILIYEALGWNPPQFAHLPLILGPDRSKLSKRHGAVSLTDYCKQGYLPEAMRNFMALLGWNPGDEREIFSLKELEKEFSLEKIQKGGAIFNIEKLNWFNSQYIRKMPIKDLTKLCLKYLPEKIDYKQKDLEKIIVLEKERITKLFEMGDATRFFFKDLKYDQNLLKWKDADKIEIKASLDKSYSILCDIKERDFRADKLKAVLMSAAKEFNNNDRGKLLWPLRVALSGRDKSPGPFEIAEILGKKKTLERIKKAIELIK